MNLNYKKYFIGLIAILSISVSAGAQTAESPFEYPTAPDSLSSLPSRAGYVIRHFWENADMKKLMNDTAQFHKAFADYVGLLPYAHPDSSRLSIQEFIKPLKEDAKKASIVAAFAEKEMFGPDRTVTNADEIYIQFIKSTLSNKKVSTKEKGHYMDQIKMMNSSQVDATVTPFSYTTRHGATHELYDQPGEYTLLYFHDATTGDYSLTRLRMETDVAINNLVKSGRLKIFDIYVGKPESGWKSNVESLPYEWEVGYSDNVGNFIDVRELPAMYLLDKDRRIMARGLNIDHLLSIAQALNSRTETTSK